MKLVAVIAASLIAAPAFADYKVNVKKPQPAPQSPAPQQTPPQGTAQKPAAQAQEQHGKGWAKGHDKGKKKGYYSKAAANKKSGND